jgi:long-chain fatty acid transport protein
MKSKLLALFLIVGLISFEVLPNGLSLNSVGPRAFGMGGAFVGYAKDYSAIYWNPAGLTQMQKNFIGVFATDVIPSATYKYNPSPTVNIDAKSKSNHYISPNLMANWHCMLSDKLTIGIGIYVPAGLGVEWDGNEVKALSGGYVVEWMSKIAAINFSPVVAFKVNDQLSFGAALNIFYGMFDTKRLGGIAGGKAYQYSESSDGLGFGVTLGALYKPSKMFSVGASFRTKTSVKMEGEAENPYMALIPGLGAPAKSDFKRDVAWPMWIAGGIAFYPTPKLVITADVQFSQWSESENEFTTEFTDAKWKQAIAPPANKFILKWKDATQIRFGAEYTMQDNFWLRGGFYIDPAPAPDETYNFLFPNISYTGITVGTSYLIKNIMIDFGAEYLIGKERDINPNPNTYGAMKGKHNMNIIAISLGFGYYF